MTNKEFFIEFNGLWSVHDYFSRQAKIKILDKGHQEVHGGDKSQIIAIASVMYADALVAKLLKKGEK